MTLLRPARRARTDRSPFGSRLLGPADQGVRALRVRVQLLLTAMLVTTNLVGAGVVFAISTFVVPAASPSRGTVLGLAIGVPVYVAAAVVVGTVSGTTTTLRAMRWALRDDEPTPLDRRRTLQVPVRLTLLQVVLWLGAAVVFTSLALTLQPERAVSTATAVVISGLVVGAVAYLLAQFVMRPLSARALAGAPLTRRPRGVGIGVRMVVFWLAGTGLPTLGLALAAILTLAGVETSTTKLAVTMLVLGVVVLVFGLLVTVLNARSVVAPVLSVRDALLDVERGDLKRSVPVYDGTELGLLQAGFNQMVDGLRERERLRDLFGRHVGREVARAAVDRGSGVDDVELGGETRTATVLFVDLVGSTTYAVEHGPTEVVAVLNRFFGVVVDEVDRRQGLVNKFVGDAVLAVFGAPVDHDDHAAAALAAARAMAGRLAEEVPELEAGIGVATGEVVAGNVGHRSRFEYTVIGDAVNSAARLTDLAKDQPGRVLVARASVDAAGAEAEHWQAADDVVLRGRSEPTPVCVPSDASDASDASDVSGAAGSSGLSGASSG